MGTTSKQRKASAAPSSQACARRREPILAQIAGFVDLFVWLLVLKSFFLPLFIIPTGSMAETLAGAYATHSCPSCGYEYPVGFHDKAGPPVVQCPNCRFREATGYNICPGCGKDSLRLLTANDGRAMAVCCNDSCARHWRMALDGPRLSKPLKRKSGDRIVVHGWPYAIGGQLGPQRWDVVVFKVPKDGQTNYIKRLIGLPGEKIEIIDGDVFVTDPHTGETRLARKTRHAQRALWFPYYNHDYRPRQPSSATGHHPRWIALREEAGWTALDSRLPRFDGVDRPRAEIRFATRLGDDPPPGDITDVYGYNAPTYPRLPNVVSDIRLSAQVTIEAGDGYVELSTSKYSDCFYARLYADGRVTLEHAGPAREERELWNEASLAAPPRDARFALANADYVVSVEIDGQALIHSTSAQYSIGPEEARVRSRLPADVRRPVVRIAAEHVRARLAHLLIERDVLYTSKSLDPSQVGIGVQDHRLELGPDQYFVCGDNSPQSLDSRWWGKRPVGYHLQQALQEGEYQIGTVPADQMIGRAFFVYLPGLMPLFPGLPNCLPDLGRVRWIH